MRLAVLRRSFSNLVASTRVKRAQRTTSRAHCLEKLAPLGCTSRGYCAAADKDNDEQHGHGTTTLAEIERRWSSRFEKEGIAEPIESIEHIIAHVLGINRITDLVTLKETKLTKEQVEQLELLCECRLSRMPVQYIIGEWDFRDITLKLEPPIFIPRPETELLVDFLLKRVAASAKRDNGKVLEIGCGSGAISLSLLHSNKNVTVTAIDANPQACELTLKNAKDLALDKRLTVLNAELSQKGSTEVKQNMSSSEEIDLNRDTFDFIVSNPPYISTEEIFKLQPEINLYEDLKALDGGFDGLRWIEAILKYAAEHLSSGGYLILEVDWNHPERIKYLVDKLYEDTLKFEHVHKDFCNKDRVVEISKV